MSDNDQIDYLPARMVTRQPGGQSHAHNVRLTIYCTDAEVESIEGDIRALLNSIPGIVFALGIDNHKE